MLLYNNSILSENMFTVEEEPKDFKAEINRSQMDYVTNMNAVTKEYLHDLAYANGETKIVTEAIDTYIAKAKVLWQKFLAWIKMIFKRWSDFIDSLYHKSDLNELAHNAFTLASTRGTDLASFRFKGSYVLHKEYFKTLDIGFDTHAKALRPAIHMMEDEFMQKVKGTWDSGKIEAAMEKTNSYISKLNDIWKNEKATNNITTADIIYVTTQARSINSTVANYQQQVDAFIMRDLAWMDQQFSKASNQRYPYLQQVLQALTFTIQHHVTEMVDMSQRILVDYQKLLGAWYPAASAYLYNR